METADLIKYAGLLIFFTKISNELIHFAKKIAIYSEMIEVDQILALYVTFYCCFFVAFSSF